MIDLPHKICCFNYSDCLIIDEKDRLRFSCANHDARSEDFEGLIYNKVNFKMLDDYTYTLYNIPSPFVRQFSYIKNIENSILNTSTLVN